MLNIASIERLQLTAESICEHVSTSPLLAQLLRQLTIDRILSEWQPALPSRSIPADSELDLDIGSSIDLQAPILDHQTKLQQFKQENWGNKVGSYYLTRKVQLDRVICSIIQVADGTIAQELYFRICSEPKIFSKLALNYSQGAESFDGGKVGPIPISRLHPTISTQLLLLKPGEISPLFTINNFYIFVRLEQVVPAQFDDRLRQILLDELFEQWLQAKIISEIGSVSVQSIETELN
ncbi:MAG: peptidylprolyl isomerase [Chamaesiphon sp.]|nr:peptidylprolyl isomerase [Chamaesiphon sp.]